MRFLLLQAEAMNKANIPLDTLEYMFDVSEYYKKRGSVKDYARTLYMMGSLYRDKKNAPKALLYFRSAVMVASTEKENADYLLLSRVYAQMALLLHEQRYPRQEILMWRNAHDCALKVQDTLMAIQMLSRQGGAYHLLGERDSALLIGRHAYNLYKKIGRDDFAAASLGPFIYYYLQSDSLKQAKSCIDEYIAFSGMINDKGEASFGGELTYFFLGNYYEKIHKCDSALYYYRLLLQFKNDIGNVENAYRGLMSTYQQIGISDSVCKYAELYACMNDSANLLNSASEIVRMQALYDFTENQQIALEKSKEVTSLWHTIYLIMALITSVIVLLYTYIHKLRKKKREEILSVNRKYLEILNMYICAENEMKSLKQGIQQLTIKKSEEIEKLKLVLLSYDENCNTSKWDVEQSLLQHDIVKRIHKYAARATVPSDSEWKDLMGIVEKLMPEFYAALLQRKEKLTEKEFKVCVLTRLNFIPTEIAALLDLTKQRISNIRAKNNEKLFSEVGSKGFDANIHNL